MQENGCTGHSWRPTSPTMCHECASVWSKGNLQLTSMHHTIPSPQKPSSNWCPWTLSTLKQGMVVTIIYWCSWTIPQDLPNLTQPVTSLLRPFQISCITTSSWGFASQKQSIKEGSLGIVTSTTSRNWVESRTHARHHTTHRVMARWTGLTELYSSCCGHCLRHRISLAWPLQQSSPCTQLHRHESTGFLPF